jgi:hypothetical protein
VSEKTSDIFRIGVGSGFAGDRMDPGIKLATSGNLDALVFECLAERTIAVAQQKRLSGQSEGFDERILERLNQTLPHMQKRSGVVVTNAGAANPRAAAEAVKLEQKNWNGCNAKIAAVTGDDVTGEISLKDTQILGTKQVLSDYKDRIVSINAYTGAEGIIDALAKDATLVITGRSSDAALFLGPIAHKFGWSMGSLDLMARGTLVGHLLECAGQLTGGYFADGGRKVVPELWNLGFPYADVSSTGDATYSKVEGTGGILNSMTVLEQLLYEIDDPSSYKTPDVIADLRSVAIEDIGNNQVKVTGVKHAGKPDQLKASVGVRDGYLVNGQVSYSGSLCVQKGIIAEEILRQRWSNVFHQNSDDISVEFVGLNSTRPWIRVTTETPAEIILRFGLRTLDEKLAKIFCQEIESLYTNGPAGGGGATANYKSTIGIVSVMVPRDAVQLKVEVF